MLAGRDIDIAFLERTRSPASAMLRLDIPPVSPRPEAAGRDSHGDGRRPSHPFAGRTTALARVLIADDHALFRFATEALLRLHFTVGTCWLADDLATSLAAASESPPDVAFVDLCIPGLGSPAGIRQLKAAMPDGRLIVLSGVTNKDAILTAIASGAQGFIPKTYDPSDVVSAVRLVLDGHIFVPPQVSTACDDEDTSDKIKITLTRRQRQIYDMLKAKKTNKQIARDLGIAENTVKVHTSSLFKILGVHRRCAV